MQQLKFTLSVEAVAAAATQRKKERRGKHPGLYGGVGCGCRRAALQSRSDGSVAGGRCQQRQRDSRPVRRSDGLTEWRRRGAGEKGGRRGEDGRRG